MNEQQFIAWESASRDTIDFKKVYVDVTGDVVTGLILSEIVYWYLPSGSGNTKLRVQHEGQLWIACRRYEWWDRARVSPKQADRSLGILVDLGIIEKKVFKFDGEPTSHVRLIWEVFLPLLNTRINTPTTNPYLPEGKNVIDQRVITNSTFGEIPVTESTTENTLNAGTQPVEAQSVPVVPAAYDLRSGVKPTRIPATSTTLIDSSSKYIDVSRYPSLFQHLAATILKDEHVDIRLSPTQFKALTENAVATPVGKFPTPQAEYEQYPAEFTEFLKHIKKAAGWKPFTEGKKRLTVGTLIEFIRGYHYPGRWLEYRPKPEDKTEHTFSTKWDGDRR